MAHNSNNLSIGRSKLGAPRFPFERSDAGDGYAASSPVTARQMTPEESRRYGPPNLRGQMYESKMTAARIKEALAEANNLDEAARSIGVHPQRLKLRMAELHIDSPWKLKQGDRSP
jgi:hypothetical protein